MATRPLSFVAAVIVLPLLCLGSASATPREELALAPVDFPEEVFIAPEVRRERAAIIRDTAAQAGMTNAVLLAGIGQVETGFAHCWSEATWACEGPSSSSCAGGPVIAGAADGPCSSQQGGLGLFQFDAGTFTDTINTYGAEIVTMEGNVGAVVPYLVTRAIQSIEGVNSEAEAIEWMNSIPVVAGNALFEEWIYFVSWRYNGCKGCSAQETKYRDGTLQLLEEMGAEFWATSSAPLCAAIPPIGAIIEEGDDCYRASGPAEFWREVSEGHAGALQWTKTTDNPSANNYGTWRLRFERADDYELEVFTDAATYGTTSQASYEVTHAGGMTVVVVDQSATEGWISLGLFPFDQQEGYQLLLGDNPGEPWVAEPGGLKIMFDAVRLTPTSSPPTDTDPKTGRSSNGSCSLVAHGYGSAWPLLLLLLAFRRREHNAAIL